MTIDLTGAPRLWAEPELTRWRRAALRALADVDPSLRAAPAGDDLLRAQLARLLGVDAARLVVTAGVRAAAAPLLLGRTEVVIERPGFPGVRHQLAAAGLRIRSEPWPRMAAAARPGGALWFTTPSRNPDGRRVGAAFLAEAAVLARAGCRVVCNGAYRWFAAGPPLPPEIVQVGTLHKLAGRGAGLGWIVADEPRGGWATLVGACAPPQHWQRTWGYFLADGGCELLLARHRELDRARAAFLGALGRADQAGRDGRDDRDDRDDQDDQAGRAEGPNLLLAVGGSEQAAVTRLAAAGVAVSPGSAFDAPFPSIRVCLSGISPSVAAAAGALVSRFVAAAR